MGNISFVLKELSMVKTNTDVLNKLSCICGIDEAGRGPLAGPVLAAAVILPDDFPIEILNDSKKLSEKKRFEIEKTIKEKAVFWAVHFVDHTIIDTINILQATMQAMEEAFFSLLIKANKKKIDTMNEVNNFNQLKNIIIDGNKIPQKLLELEDSKWEVCAIPKADSIYPSVMAASILAKNERDRIMYEYAKLYPEYFYEKHKGYPTKLHKEICKKLGHSPIQRKSFRY